MPGDWPPTLTRVTNEYVVRKVVVFNGKLDRLLKHVALHEQLQMATATNPFQHLLVDGVGGFDRQLDALAVIPTRTLAALHRK
jgi:hypothetical protein